MLLAIPANEGGGEMNFWQKSSKAQKLEQIDAGISLGMTARQIAINCGTTKDAILYLCRETGRSTGSKSTAMSNNVARIGRTVQSRRRGIPELFAPDAFEIFKSTRERSLFESHQND